MAKESYFSLVTDTIYIFTAAKQGFLDNFWDSDIFQKGLNEGYLYEITLSNACCDANIKHYDVTVQHNIISYRLSF